MSFSDTYRTGMTDTQKPSYDEFFATQGCIYDWAVESLMNCEGVYMDVDEGRVAEIILIDTVIEKMKDAISREAYEMSTDPFESFEKMFDDIFDKVFDEVMEDVDIEYN